MGSGGDPKVRDMGDEIGWSRVEPMGNRQIWEYSTYDLTKPREAVEDLDRLGRDGWEAVAMVPSWGLGWRWVHPIVLLKRPFVDDAR
jgi:hypothetical protein